MRAKTGLVAVLASAVLCLALPAFAQDTVYFDGVVGGSDTGTTGTDTSQDAYTGLYSGTLNGVAVTGFVCDDYSHNITNPESWQATAIQVSTLNSSNIGNTEFGTGGSAIGLVGYAEVANLVSAMYTFASSGPASRTIDGIANVTVTDISEAIWAITAGGASKIVGTNGTGLTANATALIAYLTTGAGAFSLTTAEAYLKTLGNLWILTPTSGQGGTNGPPQEFWVNLPEGGAILMYLMLAGSSCLGAIFLRSRKQLRYRGTA
jgi:hypothetical protein